MARRRTSARDGAGTANARRGGDSSPDRRGGTTGNRRSSRGDSKRRGLSVGRILKWLSIAVIGTMFLGIAAIAGVSWWLSADLPAPENLPDYHPPQVTTVLSAEGKVLGEIYTDRRIVVPRDAIPDVMVNAVLAAEDARFYEHKGLDYLGMLRAFIANVKAGGFVQGGSTITQQVVKTFLLSPEKTLVRKASEVLLARRLEEEFTKDEILYLYLNQIYFGHGRYGVEAASRWYFDKSVRDVTSAEAATLAALPKAPNHYSPFTDPEEALERRNWVLERMHENDFIDAKELERAKKVPLPKPRTEESFNGEWPEIADAVRHELVAHFGEAELNNLGATVHTTIRADLQKAAVDAVIASMHKLDARRGFLAPSKHLSPDKARARIDRDTHERADKEPLLGEELKGVVIAVGGAPGDERAVVALGGFLAEMRLGGHSRLDVPAGKPLVKRFEPGTVVPVTVIGMHPEPAPLAKMRWASLSTVTAGRGGDEDGGLLGSLMPAAIAASAEEKAATPGAKAKRSRVVKVTAAESTVGKKGMTSKTASTPGTASAPPSVETASLDGMAETLVRFRVTPSLGPQVGFVAIDPKTREIVALVGGAPYTRGGLNRAMEAMRPPGSAFKPVLYTAAVETRKITPATLVSDAPVPFADGYDPDNAFAAAKGRGEIRLRVAMTGSVNTAAVRVLDQIGEDALADMARRMGFPNSPPEGLSAALGTMEVTPLQLANAYAVLASGGLYAEPFLIDKVSGGDGELLWEPEREDPEERVDPAVVYIVTSMMMSVVEEGTGRAARLDRPVAGKTGTTNGARNLWFGGFTPDLVAVAFVGHDRPTPIKKEFGGSAAAPIWREFMKVALKDVPASFFPRPLGVVTTRIDPETGLLAWDGQANALEEVFLAGTEPVEKAMPPDAVSVDDWSMGGEGAGASPDDDPSGWGAIVPTAPSSATPTPAPSSSPPSPMAPPPMPAPAASPTPAPAPP